MESRSQRPLAFSKILGGSPLNFLKSSILLDLNLESNISLGPEEVIVFKQQIKGMQKGCMFSMLAIYLIIKKSNWVFRDCQGGALDVCMGCHKMHRTRVYLHVWRAGRILFWYTKGSKCLSVWVALQIFFPLCHKLGSCTSESFSQLPLCFLKWIQCHLSQKSTNQVIRRQYHHHLLCSLFFSEPLQTMRSAKSVCRKNKKYKIKNTTKQTKLTKQKATNTTPPPPPKVCNSQ